jgi:hypothetical protein
VRIDTGKPSDASHEDDQDPIEQLLLVAYPNPERAGCPGSSVLEDLGKQRVEQNDPVWNHIWHCSPCFAEYKAIRDARWQSEAIQARKRQRIKVAAGALTATLLLVVCLLWIHEKNPVSISPVPDLLATIDLSNAVVLRGGEESHQVNIPPVSKRATELEIILPRFSGTGHYAAAILKSRQAASALAKGFGTATGNDIQAQVRVRLALSSVTPGPYVLALRRQEDTAVYYYPLRIVE